MRGAFIGCGFFAQNHLNASRDMRADGVGSPLLSWTAEPWHIAQESVLLTQRAIIAAWREGRNADTSGADNLKTFAIAEAAYAAAKSGRAEVPATGNV